MAEKPLTPRNKRQQALSYLPHMGQLIADYMKMHNIKSTDLEQQMNLNRSSLYFLKRNKQAFVHTVFMFSESFGYNFFTPILEALYKRRPELKQQEPLYKELRDAKHRIIQLEAELNKLKKNNTNV